MTSIVQCVTRIFQIEAYSYETLFYSTGQWMLVIYHGKASKHYADAFEGNAPKKMPFTPCQKFILFMDIPHQRFYVSAKEKSILGFLAALNGTLFVDRERHDPFETFRPNLNRFRYVSTNTRRPMNGQYPWSYLLLNLMSGYEKGATFDPLTKDWQDDGFEDIASHTYIPPSQILEIQMSCKPLNYSTAFNLNLYQETGFIRAALSPKTLDALAAIVDYSTENGSLRKPAEGEVQLQFILESEVML
jgi:hypothetical protein